MSARVATEPEGVDRDAEAPGRPGRPEQRPESERYDPYPSRIGGEARIFPRKDPVVHTWGDARLRGPLPAEELDRYEREGLYSFQSLVEEDLLRDLAEEAARILRERRDDPSPRVVREPERNEIRSIFAVHEHEEAFHDLVRHPTLVALAEQILGEGVYVHQSRINFKPPFRGQPFHWHSDFETWHVEDGMPLMRAFSLSLNLTANRSDNGPLMALPESHHHYVSCPGETPAAHYEFSLRRQEAGTPPDAVLADLARRFGIASPVGPAGSATIFDCNVMHGSNGNITPFSRTNVFIVFNHVDNALVAPYSGQPERPSHVASRNPEPLR